MGYNSPHGDLACGDRGSRCAGGRARSGGERWQRRQSPLRGVLHRVPAQSQHAGRVLARVYVVPGPVPGVGTGSAQRAAGACGGLHRAARSGALGADGQTALGGDSPAV